MSMILDNSFDPIIGFGISDWINNGDGSFELNFSVDYSASIGSYKIKLYAFDENMTPAEQVENEYLHTTDLVVENNAPEIHDYTINGKSITNGISVRYGEELKFNFTVSDVDGTVTNITVELIGPGIAKTSRF